MQTLEGGLHPLRPMLTLEMMSSQLLQQQHTPTQMLILQDLLEILPARTVTVPLVQGFQPITFLGARLPTQTVSSLLPKASNHALLEYALL